jgi:hypothetical protein
LRVDVWCAFQELFLHREKTCDFSRCSRQILALLLMG